MATLYTEPAAMLLEMPRLAEAQREVEPPCSFLTFSHDCIHMNAI
jgi:hypothetical protein